VQEQRGARDETVPLRVEGNLLEVDMMSRRQVEAARVVLKQGEPLSGGREGEQDEPPVQYILEGEEVLPQPGCL
jgi:hypothetical protein